MVSSLKHHSNTNNKMLHFQRSNFMITFKTIACSKKINCSSKMHSTLLSSEKIGYSSKHINFLKLKLI